jgi:putative peptide zinc metalloprotease protein
MGITLDSRLLLVPIVIRKDKKHYIIEDTLSGDFYEMPEVCVDAINLINQGEKIGEIERKLKRNYPNEEINLLDFVAQLLDLELVDEIDGVVLKKQQPQKESSGILWIPPKIGQLFFNKFTYAVYVVLFVLNLALFITHPSLFPHHKDIFVFDIMVLNVILWMTITFLLVLIHELGHVLAMRSHDLPTKVEISHRLFFVVLETDMSSVWKLAPKDRNILFLAGLCFDTVLLFIALIIQLMFPNGPEITIGLMNLAIFDIVLRMIYQCCFYMKTDLYFFFENVTGCYNLIENAQQNIRKHLLFLKTKLREEVVFSGEKNTVFLYSIFYFLGVAITITLFFTYYIPEVIYAGKQLLPGFGHSPTSLAFWDAVVFSLQVSIFILLLLYSWRKKYTQK